MHLERETRMSQHRILQVLEEKILVFDGAMGTSLQAAGLKMGDIPEELNITHPELIQKIHLDYLKAGSDMISTNTFGCNSLKLEKSSYSFETILKAALENAQIAKRDCEKECFIALDIGPVGQLLEPMGSLSFDEAYNIVREQVLLAKDVVDVVLLETMTDIYEVKAAVLAIKENSDLPIFVSMTYESNQRTLSGCDPLTMVTVLEGLGVDALGVNCSLGPVELTPIIDCLLANSSIPVLIQPNAGLPVLINGETRFGLDAEGFSLETAKHVHKGVRIVGGCCGTTADYIKMLVEKLPSKMVVPVVEKYTRVSSGSQTVTFGERVIVCGERLNPTGKKKLKAALLEGRFDELVLEGVMQQKAEADVLDVNVGLPGIEEAATMKKVIKLLQEVITLPLQIDSSDPEAIEMGCRYYNGKPLINSVNGKCEVMETIFPIVKKYGGTVIGLTLDETGIPNKAEERFKIAQNIINTAAEYGISKENIIIDCLVLTASAQQAEVLETCKAVSLVKELGVHTVLGVSNVSFGLPNRPLLNKTFLTMAMMSGLDLPIINPLDEELMDTIKAFEVLNNKDIDAKKYIEAQSTATTTKISTQAKEVSLFEIVLRGLKDDATAAMHRELETKAALKVVNEILIPALNEVGNRYDSGKVFLPQLMKSAETAKLAFGIAQAHFDGEEATKGPIVIATVEGDIHDIGKNIVKAVLESYGYKIIDLGKDVAPQLVLDAFYQYKPKAIGLSALMTTTVVSMEKTIHLLKEQVDMCPIFVGGAVLTPDYAKQIDADYYVCDAMETVTLLENLLQ
ncbi:MAG: homocysteine S-methyltransferase family protein [Lachnospiraceae bacterium]